MLTQNVTWNVAQRRKNAVEMSSIHEFHLPLCMCVMKNLCLATTVKYFFVSWMLKHEFEFVQTMPTIWKVEYYESLWNSEQGSAAPICVE
jgi:hypothetical protein